MGQKSNPIELRLGIIKGWESNWFGGNDFSEKIVEDYKIRKYINARFPRGTVTGVVIERTMKFITITIKTPRPGLIIGKEGKEVDKLKEELKKLCQKDIQINIYDIQRPELDARWVADNIARQIEARVSYRKAVKMAIAASMRMGAEGIKVRVGGRLGGAEIARSEAYMEGRVPLHTLRADIDYAVSEAHTSYGRIGVKVWICRGEIFGKSDLNPIAGMKEKEKRKGNKSRRGNK